MRTGSDDQPLHEIALAGRTTTHDEDGLETEGPGFSRHFDEAGEFADGGEEATDEGGPESGQVLDVVGQIVGSHMEGAVIRDSLGEVGPQNRLAEPSAPIR